MSTVFENQIWIPPSLCQLLRKWQIKPDEELTQVCSDVWVTNKAVAFHTDSSGPDTRTYGVILVNDPGYLLMYDGQAFSLPCGSIYRIDGHKLHGTMLFDNRVDGRFAFLAWDMPEFYSLLKFKQEVTAEVDAKYEQIQQRT